MESLLLCFGCLTQQTGFSFIESNQTSNLQYESNIFLTRRQKDPTRLAEGGKVLRAQRAHGRDRIFLLTAVLLKTKTHNCGLVELRTYRLRRRARPPPRTASSYSAPSSCVQYFAWKNADFTRGLKSPFARTERAQKLCKHSGNLLYEFFRDSYLC